MGAGHTLIAILDPQWTPICSAAFLSGLIIVYFSRSGRYFHCICLCLRLVLSPKSDLWCVVPLFKTCRCLSTLRYIGNGGERLTVLTTSIRSHYKKKNCQKEMRTLHRQEFSCQNGPAVPNSNISRNSPKFPKIYPLVLGLKWLRL